MRGKPPAIKTYYKSHPYLPLEIFTRYLAISPGNKSFLVTQKVIIYVISLMALPNFGLKTKKTPSHPNERKPETDETIGVPVCNPDWTHNTGQNLTSSPWFNCSEVNDPCMHISRDFGPSDLKFLLL